MAALTKSEAKKELEKAMRSRDNLEAEAEAIQSELESPTKDGGLPAGVKGALVDREGFPRADLDLFRVRELRNRLAHIQTDHKGVMQRIEELLPMALAPDESSEKKEKKTPLPTADTTPEKDEKPFSIITNVKPGSPADQAGLVNGDLLLRFGDVTTMGELGTFTLAHLNEIVHVKIRRPNFPRALTLDITPRAWSGQGMLGCYFTWDPAVCSE